MSAMQRAGKNPIEWICSEVKVGGYLASFAQKSNV